MSDEVSAMDDTINEDKKQIGPQQLRKMHQTLRNFQILIFELATSEEFIKCRLDNFSMSFILCFVNFRICENK